MLQNSKIAVLLPVYKKDKSHYLRLSIDSILKQTYRDIILFIGVDGPIGDELDACLQKYEKLSNVVLTYFPTNRGLAVVLNDLLKICFERGFEYVARMDADDISVINRIENQFSFLCSNLYVDVVGGCIEEINGFSEKTGKKVIYPLTHQECFNFFRYRDPLAHPAVMFRKSFFDKAHGYRDEYRKNQDTMLWFDGFLNGCVFANLKETVLFFRVTDDFYRNRRNGYTRAKKMLVDRFLMNKKLKYDWSAYIFALMMFFMTLAPSYIKKILYKIR